MVAKLPQRCQVGPYEFNIRVDSSLERSGLMGECNPTQLTIFLNPDQALQQMRETAVHESLHAMFFASGLAAQMNDAHHEVAVTTLAPWLLMWLRDNKDLLKWLTTS